MTDNDPGNPIERITRDGDTVIAYVVGDVDMRRNAVFQESLMGLFDPSPGKIVIDLADVDYIDSSGLASMVKLLSRVREDGIELRLCNPAASVRSLLEITRLDTVFVIRSSVDEALTS